MNFRTTNGVVSRLGEVGTMNGEVDPAPRQWPGDGLGLYRSSEVRILVLDDDPAVCRVIQAALAPNDFRVEVVSDPNEIVDALKQAPYHLIILDYVLPGLEPDHPAGARRPARIRRPGSPRRSARSRTARRCSRCRRRSLPRR